MSLAGKILTVLVLLVILGWIYLFASVAQLNSSWGRAIVKHEQEVIEKTKTLADTLNKDYAVEQGLLRERGHTDDRLASLRRGIEELHDRVAEDRETASRADLRLEAEKSLVATSQAAVQRRTEERSTLQQDLAALEQQISELQAEESRLFDRLNGLMTQFERVIAENRQLIERKAGAPAPSSANPTGSVTR